MHHHCENQNITIKGRKTLVFLMASDVFLHKYSCLNFMSCEKYFCILYDNEDLYSTDNTEEGDNEEDEVSI